MNKVTFKNRYVEDSDGQYQWEHRRICADHFGSFPDEWHVHHINMIKDDNDPENLVALPAQLHKWVHRSASQYEFLARGGFLSRKLFLLLIAAFERKEFRMQQSLFTVLFQLGILRLHLD